MWIRKFSKIYKDIKKEDVWRTWADVNNWPKWDKELEYCDLKDDFVQGSKFILKPAGGPKVKIVLSEVIENERFTDYCKFFGATMHDAHYLEHTEDGLLITNIITVKGPLAFVWANLVAKDVAKSVPEQTDRLVNFTRSKNK